MINFLLVIIIVQLGFIIYKFLYKNTDYEIDPFFPVYSKENILRTKNDVRSCHSIVCDLKDELTVAISDDAQRAKAESQYVPSEQTLKIAHKLAENMEMYEFAKRKEIVFMETNYKVVNGAKIEQSIEECQSDLPITFDLGSVKFEDWLNKVKSMKNCDLLKCKGPYMF